MKVNCKYCFTEFDAKRKTAQFCCDLHRTLFGKLSLIDKNSWRIKLENIVLGDRNKKNEVDFVPNKNGFYDLKTGKPTTSAVSGEAVTVKITEKNYFTPANQPVLNKYGEPVLPYFDEKRIKQRLAALSWVKEVEEYCESTSITPQDLIDSHRIQNKPYKKLKQGKDVEIHPTLSIQAQAIRKKKLGLD